MGYVDDLRKFVGNRPLILVGSVVIIMNEKKEILFQQRKHPYGVWSLPGGLMELGESVEETARREVYEETGLILGDLELVDVISGKENFTIAQNGDEYYNVTTLYFANSMMGKLRVNDGESLDVKFFPKDNLPKLVKSHLKMVQSFISR